MTITTTTWEDLFNDVVFQDPEPEDYEEALIVLPETEDEDV